MKSGARSAQRALKGNYMSLGNRISRASIFFAAALSLAGCDYVNSIVHRAPNLKFEKAGTDYASKPDFAQVEYKYPTCAK